LNETKIYKKIKENIPEDNPRRAPPITSVVQCSPKLILDISIATLKTTRETLIKIFVFIFIFDFIIRKKNITETKTILRECPDG